MGHHRAKHHISTVKETYASMPGHMKVASVLFYVSVIFIWAFCWIMYFLPWMNITQESSYFSYYLQDVRYLGYGGTEERVIKWSECNRPLCTTCRPGLRLTLVCLALAFCLTHVNFIFMYTHQFTVLKLSGPINPCALCFAVSVCGFATFLISLISFAAQCYGEAARLLKGTSAVIFPTWGFFFALLGSFLWAIAALVSFVLKRKYDGHSGSFSSLFSRDFQKRPENSEAYRPRDSTHMKLAKKGAKSSAEMYGTSLAGSGAGSGAKSTASSHGSAKLPKPWVALKSSNGDVYYYNEQTGESSWDVPTQ
jgi:hypothetical protein